MRPGPFSRCNLRSLLLWLAPLAWLGCGGGGTDVLLPSLSVTTSTTGVEVDPDGYSVTVDALAAQPIGLDASITIDRLTDGPHNVTLSGLAANCLTQAENPRTVTVQSGSTASVAFAIICSATNGTIEVSAAASGAGSDSDGFALILDGTDRGAIGVSGTVSLTGVTPGAHTVGLTGLAANCQVVGDNPRSVTVISGQTTQVPFAVTCAQPPPSTGGVQITTATSGSPPDPDGYTLSVDGAAGQVIGVNASLTLSGLSVGSHTLRLAGLAANCQVSSQNPLRVSVTEGQTVPASFTIACVANTGGLTVTISGLPAGTAAAVTVAGPGGFSRTLTATEGLTGLAAGSYTVRAATVTTGGRNYTATVDPPAVSVAPGATAAVTVTYRAPAGTTLNLRIDGLYLTQSTQTRSGAVPLVGDRAAFLRVFVVANEVTTARPSVRVRLLQDGAVTRTITISAPTAPPTQVQEGTIGSSWNTRIDASLIRPGLSVVADVDPGNTVAETNENDNSFPASGTPQSLDVRAVPTATIRFVPVFDSANNLQGDVGNTDALVEQARRMYPLHTIQTDLHKLYSFAGPLQPEDQNGQWHQILTEMDVLRVVENSSRTYFGVVKLNYSAGIVGIGFVGETSANSERAAVGWDEPTDVGRVVAHELGHTWGQLHTPCRNPPNIDPNYPYPAGNIGVYGYDVTSGTLKSISSSDIMGYCGNFWISDYIYRRVMTFRQAQPAGAGVAGLVQPCLLVWGHIVNGQPVLEPAFQIVTRPKLPSAPGPYSVEATANDGSRIFSLSFDAAAVADDPRGSRSFAFAVPLGQSSADRVGNLRFSTPVGRVATTTRRTAQLQRGAVSDSIEARRDAGSVTLRWSSPTHPMIMVRDPDTGEVLSFARGGSSRVWTAKSELDLEVSDGLGSHRVRLAINRP